MWANVDNQLTDHHEREHEIVWPALGASMALIATMDEEHDTVADALAEARTAMARLKASAKRPGSDRREEIQAWSVETAATFDLDSELELWFSVPWKVWG